ncbi:hybrid sensor histidine kinase/response regulator [Maricaulis sp. CAU 1757]
MAVLVLSLLPATLQLIGFDFGLASSSQPVTGLASLRGATVHALLEWSTVILASVAVLLALIHYRTSGDMIAPILAFAMFASGLMDAFHTLAALEIIVPRSGSENFIPVTWALARGFNAFILLAGAILAYRFNLTPERHSIGRLAGIGLAFGLLALLLISLVATSSSLPQTQFPDQLVSRPYDIVPLLGFAVAGLFLWRLHQRTPSLFVGSVLLALIPAVVLELHMAFGSTRLFDSDFNVAHGLKVLEYAIPVIGIAAEYIYQARRLAEASREARRASHAKSTFLANMSHEIRTPLNGVLGMTQALQQTELSPDQREMLDLVNSSGRNLTDILNSILDVSKIEAGKLELETVEFSLHDRLSGSVSLHRYAASEKTLRLLIDIADNCKGMFHGDPVRLQQIMQNLLSNAIKFTPSGQVIVRAHCVEADGVSDELDRLVIEVEDTGIGIAKEKLETLFDPFIQADSSTTRRFGGSGLGLSIVKSLVDLMGGEISVESQRGEGSVFKVDLPIKRVGPAPNKEEMPASAAPPPDIPVPTSSRQSLEEISQIRILAAEDVVTNQIVLHALLDKRCKELIIVEDGLAAVEAWRSRRPDLVLMDKHMPVLDGLEAIRTIRDIEQREFLDRTPIIALSADTLSHHVEELLASGADAHVPKPLDLGRLLAALNVANRKQKQPH